MALFPYASHGRVKHTPVRWIEIQYIQEEQSTLSEGLHTKVIQSKYQEMTIFYNSLCKAEKHL